jgi:hypothetical protein
MDTNDGNIIVSLAALASFFSGGAPLLNENVKQSCNILYSSIL